MPLVEPDMRAVSLTSSRFISQRSRFGLYGRQVALTNRAATVPMSELCPAPALGVAPFLNERNGGTPGISERTFLLDPPLAEAGEVKTKGEQNMKTNYDRADAD